MNRVEKYDLKLGLFVYNPDQELIKDIAKERLSANSRNWTGAEAGIYEEESVQEPLVETEANIEDDFRHKFRFFSKLSSLFGYLRFFCLSHRPLNFDQDNMKFFLTTVILWQAFLIFVWSLPI